PGQETGRPHRPTQNTRARSEEQQNRAEIFGTTLPSSKTLNKLIGQPDHFGQPDHLPDGHKHREHFPP
ncbi:MAG: hypothetical protein ACLQDC_16285, partial [Verrucomicrobiia bacterium]